MPEARLSLGVYVLGAIDPAERALVDSHLLAAATAVTQLAGLAGIPALLSRVGAEEAFALAESDGPPASAASWRPSARARLSRLVSCGDRHRPTSARRRRRRWRDASLGVAAALIIAAGVSGRPAAGLESAADRAGERPVPGPLLDRGKRRPGSRRA